MYISWKNSFEEEFDSARCKYASKIFEHVPCHFNPLNTKLFALCSTIIHLSSTVDATTTGSRYDPTWNIF